MSEKVVLGKRENQDIKQSEKKIRRGSPI